MKNKTGWKILVISIALVIIASGIAVGAGTCDMSVVYNGTSKGNGVVNKSWKSVVQMDNSTDSVFSLGSYEKQLRIPTEEYWAVIVEGTSVYAHQDAKDMYNVLINASDNWDADHIRLVNKNATKINIRNAIQWMANKASTEDTCLFYFSGHGGYTIDCTGDEADCFDESLNTSDDDIIDDELEEWISEVKAQKVVAILDACFSGGVLTPFQIGEAVETYDIEGFAIDLEKANCLVLTACRMNEECYGMGELKNGRFTYFIVQGLWGAADQDDDGIISVRELCDYSFPKIVEYEEDTQHPLLWPEDTNANSYSLIKLKTSIPKKISVPEEYRTIQEAVEAAMPGDEIEVSPGTYTENVIINKPLTINARQGDSIIQATNTNLSCIFITADSTSISGLTCQNGYCGIQLYKSNNSAMTNNIVSDNFQGIYLSNSYQNIIANNTAKNNGDSGIYLKESNNNRITNNNCSSNHYQGINLILSNDNIIFNNTLKSNGNNGIYLTDSSNNTIRNNKATNNLNYVGISLDSGSNNNSISGNDVSNNNQSGIYLEESNNNRITDNNASNSVNYNGIALDSSTNNEIRNNIANYNRYQGIGLWTSSENIIANNTAKSNGENGIYLEESDNNIVTENKASNNDWNGIFLQDSNTNTITDNEASNNVNYNGISLDSSTDNEISNNIANSNYYQGIGLWTSNENIIANNTAKSNGECGIYLDESNNNIVTENKASNNDWNGISLYNSSSNRLRNNLLYDNRYNFGVEGYSYSDFDNDIDTSNTVDGKPIYYWIGQQDEQIPDDAGVVGVVNSINITVRDMTLTNNLQGVIFAYTINSKIENVTASNNWDGIRLKSSSNNTLTNNNASGNDCDGIWLWNSSNYNTLTSNTASNNNYSGIRIEESNSNKIYLNNFINNTDNVHSYDSNNIWNSSEKISYTCNGNAYIKYLGNYWSDYKGSDADGDGIGDTPYILDGDKDNYPLMERFEKFA
ncbi:Cell surface glycoprotein [ANME-1 cluster archaeon GoMg1]|nr:Cell surface glycoprotein [ANME-1 cluster archaeon GoMg1]